MQIRIQGEAWARKAIWGTVPSDLKNKIEGGVEALTSGQFIALWTERVDGFMARNIEPPAAYAQHTSKGQEADAFSRDRQQQDEGRCDR